MKLLSVTAMCMLLGAATPTMAQGSDAGTTTSTGRTDDNHTDYGWIGLAGLLGLLGLRRKDDRRNTTSANNPNR